MYVHPRSRSFRGPQQPEATEDSIHLCFAEFVISGHSGGLFLFSVDASGGKVDVVEEFIMEAHRHAAAEENHYFLVPILFQKCKQQQKALFCRTHYKSLLQSGHCGDGVLHLRCTYTADSARRAAPKRLKAATKEPSLASRFFLEC